MKRVAEALGSKATMFTPEEGEALLQSGALTWPGAELQLLFHLDDLSTLDDPGKYASQEVLQKLASAPGPVTVAQFVVVAWESEDRVHIGVLVPKVRFEAYCDFMEEYRDQLEGCEEPVSDEARAFGPQRTGRERW